MKWYQRITLPIAPITQGVKTKFYGPWNSIRQRLSGLRFAQKCYFLAILIWLAGLILSVPSNLSFFIVFSLVILGLVQEIFPKFAALWHLLPGKALILFIYAVVANFALASAGSMVNSLTGISAQALPYTHNYAMILMVPGWFIITSLLGLLLVQVFMPIYLIILLILKPFGSRALWHDANYKYPFTTAVVRYAWLIALLVKVAVVSVESGVLDFLPNTNVDMQVAAPDVRELGQTEPLTEESISSEAKAALNGILSKFANYKSAQQELLASFLFNYEADSKSRCAHPANSRVVEINNYEILLIEPKDELEVGYSYQVIQCESPAFGKGKAP
ncbi:hypothetical protein [uncultured Paraglaciecola sp.]|uniref:hypothetical protein n=1 Tax=uncultured Paraglaciecola sp. TaxID=1765024 RepID=UPI0025917508|nr:hypothetical protein [uncultured Paraglaciecola sp.]